MSEHPDDVDACELDAALARLAAEPLRVEAVDPRTGERVEASSISIADHLATAIVDRDEGR
jgi:hypothetical protein